MSEDQRIGEFVPIGDVIWEVIAKSIKKRLESQVIPIIINQGREETQP